MTIREYAPEDEQALRELHEMQGHPYEFPDLNDPQFVGIIVMEDGGKIVQAVAARKTIEVYFLADPKWKTPAWRLVAFAKIHLVLHMAMLALGFRDSHCWLPPSVEKSFGRRLTSGFGWVRSPWSCFSKEL
jgi:hypothetical protein